MYRNFLCEFEHAGRQAGSQAGRHKEEKDEYEIVRRAGTDLSP